MADKPRHSSAVTLDRILATARDAFAEHGFDGARLDSIAKAAGVTKQLVYHYFKTKEELYSVVLDRVSDEVLAMLDSPDYDTLPPGDAVCSLIGRVIDAYVERPYIAGMTVDQGLHKGEHISRHSKYMPSVRVFVAERVAPMLERGVAEGLFRPDIDARLFYWSIFALASAPFTQSWAMAQSTGIDFSRDDGIALWRDHVSSFALQAIMRRALPR
ncbi:TetR/AcrR family transcriptional regulator [Novosphingobium sp.]|uniref:TetR/AcrR family transcriptional regulator n=1 Tax=Novosphingobium sp. TaxID=1874826 RepID=UPI002221B99C|nr:TetR/AcrR family transcriptional regulator [Novosphingobium sp.]MCW1402528.1 TetR family transcriptional regulator [Novosphingobium sp. MW5]